MFDANNSDPNVPSITFKYDDCGPAGIQGGRRRVTTWSYTYDAHGNVLTETDPSGVTLTYEYDALHRRTLIRDELNNERHFEYDQLGQLTIRIAANDGETTYNYDALGRLTCVVDAENGWTEYRYDEAGNLIEIEDARDEVVSIRQYDALDRLVYAEDGNGNFYEYGYDPVGNQTWVKDVQLQETFLTYDAENRLIQIDYPDLTQVTYVYDDNGNRTDMTDPTGSSHFVYDELNRLRSSTDSFGQTVGYSYDPVGNRVGVTYPDMKQVVYGYDDANRLEMITDWDTRVTQYTYNGLRVETVTFPSGVLETRGYDDAGRLSSMDTEDSGSTPLINLGWVRDGEGNPTSVTETGTLQPTLEQLVVDYEYDADNRLTESSQASYEYDANGNLTSRAVGGLTTSFTYDSEDRLVEQITVNELGDPVSVALHSYDGDGNRIMKMTPSDETHYVLDRGRGMSHVLCETDYSGGILAYYIHGPQVVARIDAVGNERYYHTNDIGSVVALTDDNEQITDRYGYSPFGLLRSQQGMTPNPFTYVGGLGVMAEADGLYFMRARFYDPRYRPLPRQGPGRGHAHRSEGLAPVRLWAE